VIISKTGNPGGLHAAVGQDGPIDLIAQCVDPRMDTLEIQASAKLLS